MYIYKCSKIRARQIYICYTNNFGPEQEFKLIKITIHLLFMAAFFLNTPRFILRKYRCNWPREHVDFFVGKK